MLLRAVNALTKSKRLSTSFPSRTIKVRRLTYEKRQLETQICLLQKWALAVCLSVHLKQKLCILSMKFIDLGINFFDTADLYDYGLNEEFVGKALKGRRDQIVLTTKVGNRWTEEKWLVLGSF